MFVSHHDHDVELVAGPKKDQHSSDKNQHPSYHGMNIHTNVDYIDAKHGLELQSLSPCKEKLLIFHVRVPPAQIKQKCVPLPELQKGENLLLTHLKTGEAKTFVLDKVQFLHGTHALDAVCGNTGGSIHCLWTGHWF
jgi:hypothetical protein